jgi:hypothetical protein
VVVQRKGDDLIAESLPNTEGSYLLLRLKLDDGVATGTWQETSSPNKHFKGMTYTGALQLVLGEDGKTLDGKWLGISRELFVKDGSWRLVRIGKVAPVQPAN